MGDLVWLSDEEDSAPCPQVRTTTFTRGGGRGRGGGGSRRSTEGGVGGEPPLLLRGPAGCAGRIIGRGGVNVNRIRGESGAQLEISDEGDHTLVKVTGTPSARAAAERLLQPILNDAPPPRNPPRQRFRSPSPKRDNPPAYNNHQTEAPPEDDTPIDWQALNEKYQQFELERAARLVPIIKDLYREHPAITAMTKKEVDQWRLKNNNISVAEMLENETVQPREIPNPITEFEYGFSEYPDIMEEIRKQGFTHPSPIQGQAWPILLSGRDMIGIAQTGTGKTLAFLLPALIHIDSQTIPRNERTGPNVLVLAPTRELALQIEKEVNKYHYKDIKAVCIYGGASRKGQIEKVSKGVQIVIATPGRLNDLVDANHIDIEAVTYLVLDEADRMLDMGFEPQIRKSLLNIRPDRQTIMTSATWPTQVRRLAATYMKNPVQVVVGSLDLAAVHTVTQEIVHMREEEKFDEVIHFLKSISPSEKVIVFCGRRDTATWLATEVAMLGLSFQSIYGGLDQADREQAVEDMQNGSVNILIATDIASRGLDIEDVTHVVNYDFPRQIEEYVHRIGRTGRAGKHGTAISYITNRDCAQAEELIKILTEADQEVPNVLHKMVDKHRAKVEDLKSFKDQRRGRY